MRSVPRVHFDTDADDDEYATEAARSPSERYRRRGRAGQERTKERLLADLTGITNPDAGFTTTYQPARFEEGWLLSSLRGFYDQHLITDVLAQVKGGKEATVYRCAAHPTTGRDLLAAKVYRPRQFRNLRNDKLYREGRPILTEEGRPVKATDDRLMRAVGKKTAFGVQVQHTSWLMYEYTTLLRLYEAGAAVPQPFAAAENAILMSYHGDVHRPAPTLSSVSLDPDEAEELFQEVLRNVELMLRHGLIHGDLSAYNVLYWEGTITIIDFPQVTSSEANPQALAILTRDVTRVCDYFAREGVRCDPDAIVEDLWARYGVAPESYAVADGSS
jgi:RIO kinase 1